MARRNAQAAFAALVALLLPIVGVTSPAHASQWWADAEPPWSVSGEAATDLAIGGSGTSALTVTRNPDTWAVSARAGAVAGNKVTWSAATQLDAVSDDQRLPQVALSADGSVGVVAWLWGSELRVRVADIAAGSATWRGSTYSAVDLGDGPAGTLDVRLSPTAAPNHLVTAVWDEELPWSIESVSGSVSATGVNWGTTSTVTTDDILASPALATSSDGSRVTAVWTRQVNDAGTITKAVESASATVADSLAGPVISWGTEGVASQLSSSIGATTAYLTDHPGVALSADGLRAAAIWEQYNVSAPANVKVVAGVAAISGTAGATTTTWNHSSPTATPTVSTPAFENAVEPRIALSSDGSVVNGVWRLPDSETVQGWHTTITAGALDLAIPGELGFGVAPEPPALAVSSDGMTGAAAWIGSESDPDGVVALSLTGGVWGFTDAAVSLAGRGTGAPLLAGSDSGGRAIAAWNPEALADPPGSAAAGGLIDVPPPPVVGQVGDTLTLGAGEGTPTLTSYQIAYSTQARIDAGKNWAVWATRWPAEPGTVDLAAMQTAAACDAVAATATPDPGHCARAIGEQAPGDTAVFRVSAVSANGRSAPTILTVTRPTSVELTRLAPESGGSEVTPQTDSSSAPAPDSLTEPVLQPSASPSPYESAVRNQPAPLTEHIRSAPVSRVRVSVTRDGRLRVLPTVRPGATGSVERVRIRVQRRDHGSWRTHRVRRVPIGRSTTVAVGSGRYRIVVHEAGTRIVSRSVVTSGRKQP